MITENSDLRALATGGYRRIQVTKNRTLLTIENITNEVYVYWYWFTSIFVYTSIYWCVLVYVRMYSCIFRFETARTGEPVPSKAYFSLKQTNVKNKSTTESSTYFRLNFVSSLHISDFFWLVHSYLFCPYCTYSVAINNELHVRVNCLPKVTCLNYLPCFVLKPLGQKTGRLSVSCGLELAIDA